MTIVLWILFPVSFLLERDGYLDNGAGGDVGLVILQHSKIRSFLSFVMVCL